MGNRCMSKHRRVNPLTLKLRELRVHRDTSTWKVTTWEARPPRRFEPISAIESAFGDIEIPSQCTIRRGIMCTNFTVGNRAVCKGLINRKRARSSERKKGGGRKSFQEEDRTVKFRGGGMGFYRFNISLFYDWPSRCRAWPTESAFLKNKCVFCVYHCIFDFLLFWSLIVM